METLGHGALTSVGPRHDTAAKASMTHLAALYPMASVTCKSEPTKPNERCSTEIAAKAQTCSTAVAPPLNVYSLPRCDRTGNEADPRLGLVSRAGRPDVPGIKPPRVEPGCGARCRTRPRSRPRLPRSSRSPVVQT